MGRSTRNRGSVDYSKFCSEDKSDQDDDFEESPVAPPSKKAKVSSSRSEKQRKEKKTCESRIAEEKSPTAGRKTRASNPDVSYEQDLQAAIELSKVDKRSASRPDVESHVIIDSDDEDIVEKVLKTCGKRAGNKQRLDEEGVDDVDPQQLACTVPVETPSATRKRNSVDEVQSDDTEEDEDYHESEVSEDEDGEGVRFESRSSKRGKNAKADVRTKGKTCDTDPTEARSKLNSVGKLTGGASRQPMRAPAKKNSSNADKQTLGNTPVGSSFVVNYASARRAETMKTCVPASVPVASAAKLRLGLSRNSRLKPLHQNVSFKLS